MKTLSCFILFCLIVSYSSQAFSQEVPKTNSNYQISIRNISGSQANTIEFDIFLLNLDKKVPFELALFQAGITVNPGIYNGGTITASLVPGSSELLEAQQPQTVIFSQAENTIKLPSRLMKASQANQSSGPRGTIISVKKSGTRICRIKLENTRPFLKTEEMFSFSFSKLPYATSVYSYIDGVNTVLNCSAENCIVKP